MRGDYEFIYNKQNQSKLKAYFILKCCCRDNYHMCVSSHLYARSLDSLQLLLDVSQLLLLPLNIGLNHSSPLLQLLL